MQAGMSFAATGSSSTIQSGVTASATTGLVPRWAITTSTVTTLETVFIRDAMQASSTGLATEVFTSTLRSMVPHNATFNYETDRHSSSNPCRLDCDNFAFRERVIEDIALESCYIHPAQPSGDLFGHNIFGPPPSVMSSLYAEAQASSTSSGGATSTPELEGNKAQDHAALRIADILPLNRLLKEGVLKKHQVFGAFFIALNISEDTISLAHVHDLDRIVVVNKPGEVAGGQPSAGGTSSATPHPTSTTHAPEVDVPPVSAKPAVPTTPASTAFPTSSSSSTKSSPKSTPSRIVVSSTTSTLQASTESSSPSPSTASTMASVEATDLPVTANPSTSTVTMITTVYPEDATITAEGPQRQVSSPTATRVGGLCVPETTIRQHTMGEGSMASIQENTVIIHKTHRGNICAPISTTTIPHSEGTAIATADTKTGRITSRRVIPTVSGHPGFFFTTHMPVPTS
ncbi:hypothetical protein KC345_g575 [Hortaea werneckii]|nr:hypothetical protein KC345_g575 [Hortaea werneckii]